VPVHFSSLDRVAERIIDHLRREHHTALVGSPGCGTTTFVTDLAAEIAALGFRINRFDAGLKSLSDLLSELASERAAGAPQQVVILDHVANLPADSFRRLVDGASSASDRSRDIFLWCGSVDARAANLCSVPSAHVSFPVLSRHELLSAYRHIAAEEGCRWGDAVLYLLLDLCGTDLSLVRSITDYLTGDWSDRLYDDTVWDRISDWLEQDQRVDSYRSRLASLRADCADTLALVRFGGKPLCKRVELIEETDDGLRRLCLNGFLAPNLLPGFYELRNLLTRFLLDESMQLESLFRRATNERVGALLQDAEMMLRHVIASVFTVIGIDAAKAQLEKMQQPGEVIEEKLNEDVLKWSRETNPDADGPHKALTTLITDRRKAFKTANSVWATTQKMMERDQVTDDGSRHIQSIDYLTFDQLGTLMVSSMDYAFPRIVKGGDKKRVRESWQEGVAKIRRLRNQVAHLRNVSFQDMEDLARTLERMRRDVIDYGGWKLPAAADAPDQAVPREAQ
jgi:hypothetical protein